MIRYFIKIDNKSWVEVDGIQYDAAFQDFCGIDIAWHSGPVSFFYSRDGKTLAGRVLHAWRDDAYSWDEEFMRVVRRGE